MQFTNICTDDTMMELVEHGTDDFPFQYYYEDIKKFDRGYIDWHWHREFEFVSVESGEVHCVIGALRIALYEGDAIFINTGIVHRFEAPESGIIPNILFSPDFIAPTHSRIYKKYVGCFPDSDISCAVFRAAVPWQHHILKQLSSIYDLCRLRKEGWELVCHAATSEIWSLLYAHREECITADQSGLSLLIQRRLKHMTEFIEENYASGISLLDIADAGTVSKSEALRCFQAGFLTSPVDYLIKYRLKKAYGLLQRTTDNITTISYKVGIENISYFNRSFKREFGMTPKKVRALRNESQETC